MSNEAKVMLPTGEVRTPGDAARYYAARFAGAPTVSGGLATLIDALVANGSLPLDKLLAELPGCVEWEGEGKP